MILVRYRTLGALPEFIVFVFLCLVALALGAALLRVELGHAVVLVPEANRVGTATPAVADEDYARNLAQAFLSNWMVWNEHTYQFRRSQAIGLLATEARPGFTAQLREAGWVVRSLAQSQSFLLDRLDVRQAGGGSGELWEALATGRKRTYYGGVGGSEEPLTMHLTMAPRSPTPELPVALLIIGLREIRPEGSR